jgi:23S rRNA (guanosine2251-2'-O)-methyltransferase
MNHPWYAQASRNARSRLLCGQFGLFCYRMQKRSHAEIAVERTPVEQIGNADRVPLIIVVENVRSLYNVGSIFRTADGVMLERLILTGFSPHPPRKEIDKTALGATKTVPHSYIKKTEDAIREVKGLGYRIVALELTTGSMPLWEARADIFPLCLVVGNEITGVSSDVLGLCDGAIEIPMYGTKQSFNVAVAFGIAAATLGEVWRKGQSNARV